MLAKPMLRLQTCNLILKKLKLNVSIYAGTIKFCFSINMLLFIPAKMLYFIQKKRRRENKKWNQLQTEARK